MVPFSFVFLPIHFNGLKKSVNVAPTAVFSLLWGGDPILTKSIQTNTIHSISFRILQTDRIFYTKYYPSPHSIWSANKDGTNQQSFYFESGRQNMYGLTMYKDELWFRQSGTSLPGHQVFHVKKDGTSQTATREPTDFAVRCFAVYGG